MSKRSKDVIDIRKLIMVVYTVGAVITLGIMGLGYYVILG